MYAISRIAAIVCITIISLPGEEPDHPLDFRTKLYCNLSRIASY